MLEVFSFVEFMTPEGEVEEGFICQIDLNRPPILMVEIERKGTKEVQQQQLLRQKIKSLSEQEVGLRSNLTGI